MILSLGPDLIIGNSYIVYMILSLGPDLIIGYSYIVYNYDTMPRP